MHRSSTPSITVLTMMLISAVLTGVPAGADVSPPLEAVIEQLGELPAPGTPIPVHFSVTVPRTDSNREAQIRLTLTATGAVRLVGQSEWRVDHFELDQRQEFTASAVVQGYGDGGLRLQAESFDAAGQRLWGKADEIFILQTPGDALSGGSSSFELKREKLRRDRARQRLNAAEYTEEVDRLIEGKELRFEMEMRGVDTKKKTADVAVPKAVVASVAVSGKATYTHRTGVNAGANVFAAAADARPIVNSTVRFYDRNGATNTQLVSTPPVVVTDASGNYTATVPGVRADNVTAVNLVVGISTDNDAVTVGPIGGGLYQLSTPASPVDAATKTVNVVVDSSTPTALAGFSIAEAALVAFNFVRNNNSRTGVGAAPAKIWVEYPGNNANGSFFSTDGGDHLNVGQNHAFDWDVLTHEYGHYVQKINNTTANPGGKHIITKNNTGYVQPPGDGGRTLTKDQAIKLAWGEGWPTFFGTNLQIAVGAGAFGIYTAGDTVYTDTGNRFKYDLESNSDLKPGTGEDNELSVQRILWDFADGPQDGHDEVTFGTDEMWKQLNSDPKPVTLDQFRAKFDNIVPPLANYGYSTGSQEENRIKYARTYFDHNVGPEPLEPKDNFASATPPKFGWKTKGAGNAPSYHFNKFNVLFFNKDYSTLIFTSPEIPTAAGSLAADGQTAAWTPTAEQWTTITTGDQLIHWVVQGTNDSMAPTTGPYRGLDRTIGGLSIAFVIDDTGSMSEEIAGVRAGLTAFIDTLRGLATVRKPKIEVITFKDGVTHRIASDNLDEIQSVVDGLSAYGGDDCPEASGEALLAALNDLGPAELGLNGVIIFATDASPHAGFDLTGIKLRALAKGVIVYQIVTGDCAPDGGLPAGAAAARSAAGCSAGSDNHDPNYVPHPRDPSLPVWPRDVICEDCPVSDEVGPFMSPNILKLVGDYSLPQPSSVASYTDLATASPNGQFLYLPGVNSGDPEPFKNAVTNAALASVMPTVLGVQPNDGYPGATMDVQVLGGNTNFQSNSVLAISGGGITINHQTPISPTTLAANITVDPAATTGFRNVTVTTNLGGGNVETAAGTGQFRISAASGYPQLTSVVPATVARATSVRLSLSGLNTHFVSGVTSVTIGDPYSRTGITVDALTVKSATALQADITVSNAAPLGFFRIIVTTSDEYVYIENTLAVVTSLAPPVTIPKIISVVPRTGSQGTHDLDLAVTGQNTNFINGTTTGSVNGSGIAVGSTSVTSATTATVRINIAADAPLGFRDVVLTTGGETAALIDGFQVVTGVSSCTGDCESGGTVTVDELVKGVNIALGNAALDDCAEFDSSGDLRVTVDELVQAVNNALNGCPAPPTRTPTPSPTSTSLATSTPSPTSTSSATSTTRATNTPYFETITPTPTERSTATPSFTPSVTITASPTGSATATPSSSPSVTTTASPTGSVTATPSLTPTPTATSGPSATPGGSTVPQSVAGGAVAVANGMAVIPSVITAIVSGVQFGGGAAADISAPFGLSADTGGAAGSCPRGGTATSSGSIPGTMNLTLTNCTVATADGRMVVNGTASLSGFFPPLNFSANVQVRFTDTSGATTRMTASANLTGTINPQLGGDCYVTGATLQITSGSLTTQVPGDGGVTIGFINTTVDVDVANFITTDCTPVNYSLTFNDRATVSITTGSGAAANQSFDVTFTDFVVAQDARNTPTQTQLNGAITSACFGGTVGLQTLASLTQTVGTICPTNGTLKITVASVATAQIFYLAGGVGIDTNLDNTSEQTFDSCLDTALLTCVQAVTPTVVVTATNTRTPTSTVTGTLPPSATASPTGTGVVPPSPTLSPTRTSSATVSATPTRTATPTPSPTPTKTSGTRTYCDTLSGPLAIPDGQVDINGHVIPAVDTITIPDDVTIGKVRVQLQINHTWVGDLVVFLDHIDTLNYTTLLYRPGDPALPGDQAINSGCQNDDILCTFDDAAAQAAENQCSVTPPAIGGTVQPFEPLNFFDGESSIGTWQLEVYDTSQMDSGTLVSWCVEVS